MCRYLIKKITVTKKHLNHSALPPSIMIAVQYDQSFAVFITLNFSAYKMPLFIFYFVLGMFNKVPMISGTVSNDGAINVLSMLGGNPNR